MLLRIGIISCACILLALLLYGIFKLSSFNLITYFKNSNQPFTRLWLPFYGNCYYLHQKHHVFQVMNQPLKLTRVQSTVNSFMNHQSTINCFDTSAEEWKKQHVLFKELNLNGGQNISDILQRLDAIYFNSHMVQTIRQNPKQLRQYLMMFLELVWFEFTYGIDATSNYSKIQFTAYVDMRASTLSKLGVLFSSHLLHVPILGKFLLRLVNWRSDLKDHTGEMKNQARYLMGEAKRNSWIHEVTEKLGDQSTFENSQLMCLIVDFLHNVYLDFLLRPIETDLNTSISAAFLFDIRPRTNTRPIEIKDQNNRLEFVIPANSQIHVDLNRSGWYFSLGARSCVGMHLVKGVFLNYFTDLRKRLVLPPIDFTYRQEGERRFIDRIEKSLFFY